MAGVLFRGVFDVFGINGIFGGKSLPLYFSAENAESADIGVVGMAGVVGVSYGYRFDSHFLSFI